MEIHNDMVLGLAIFFGIHCLSMTPLRDRIVTLVGELPFKGVYALLSFAGLYLIIQGYQHTEYEQLWLPVAGYTHLAYSLMPFACILIAATYFDGHIKRKSKNPMLIGTLIWSAVHLLANGDIGSSVIFVSFALYSVINMAFGKSRPNPSINLPRNGDVLAVVTGLLMFTGFFLGHEYITGIPLFLDML